MWNCVLVCLCLPSVAEFQWCVWRWSATDTFVWVFLFGWNVCDTSTIHERHTRPNATDRSVVSMCMYNFVFFFFRNRFSVLEWRKRTRERQRAVCSSNAHSFLNETHSNTHMLTSHFLLRSFLRPLAQLLLWMVEVSTAMNHTLTSCRKHRYPL